jgi:hypothetical protein
MFHLNESLMDDEPKEYDVIYNVIKVIYHLFINIYYSYFFLYLFIMFLFIIYIYYSYSIFIFIIY